MLQLSENHKITYVGKDRRDHQVQPKSSDSQAVKKKNMRLM